MRASHCFTGFFLCRPFCILVSNPSPGYVERVASAFTTGSYSSNGIDFGTGEYGDLEATVASILLDKEPLTVAVDADPTFGSAREPLLRVMHVMRSLEYDGSEVSIKFYPPH